jgi:hypothetical protein
MRFSERLLLMALVLGSVMVLAAGRAAAEPSEHPFEIEPGSFHVFGSTDQAAAHENLTTEFNFAHDASGRPYNDVRNTVVNLPAGFAANNTTVSTCSPGQLLGEAGEDKYLPACPLGSQIGLITVDLTGFNGSVETLEETQPIYNMEVTSFGVAAELGFKVAGTQTQLLVVKVRPADEGLTVTAPNVSKLGEPRKVTVVVWGLPAAHEHDAQRGETCGYEAEPPSAIVCHNEFGGPQEAHLQPKPFLADPTSCGMFNASMTAYSWEEPFGSGEPLSIPEASDAVGPIGECERVPFAPSIEVQPTTRSAESPTGLNVSLIVPQTWENPYSIATSNLKDTTVTLPEGITINPSAGSGLGACTRAQYESETSSSLPGEGCPPESKIGSIVIETPLLAEKIPGAVYIATPYENVPEFGSPEHPGGSLLALYVVAKDPVRGIIVKVAGKVALNPVTGQLTTTFLNTPQQPFNKFTLAFRPGATAPLVSPPACGSYGAQGELTPWSAPSEPRLVSSTPFKTTQGVREGPCPSGGVPPFKPQVISGTENNDGSSYSPFYLRIIRADGEQEITKFTTILPPGLTGNLTGIPFCPEADIEAARGVSGTEEEEHPSCPAASEIGHTIVEAGVGTVLAQTPGKVYLAGPYHGAPLSVVSITSAKVGPFDLGTVVIRFALDINPITAQVEISGANSDPIPHIIKGIVVHVRDIRVYMDREKFILNPTSCDPMSISDTITGAGADPANPADQAPVTVSTPFEAADCASLQFKPTFKVSTTGKTSRKTGAGLSVDLRMPGALGSHSNIRSVKVDLPKQLPSRLTTLQKACTDAQFEANPSGCPSASKVGYAIANTPILPVPLEGPAYFVSHGGAKFPELIIVLQGYGFTIDLHGETFINKAGITSSTFHAIPDEPVGSFQLTLPQGEDSALAANGNLCAVTQTVTVKKKVTVKSKGHKQTVTRKVVQTEPGTLTMPTAFVAQNGAEIHQNTPIEVIGCPATRAKTKTVKAKKAAGKSKHGKR